MVYLLDFLTKDRIYSYRKQKSFNLVKQKIITLINIIISQKIKMNPHDLEETADNMMKNGIAYISEDQEFLKHLNQVVEKKKANTKKMFDECQISDEQCEEIAQYAQLHDQANVFNTTSMLESKAISEGKYPVCKCCKRAFGENLPICMNEENLSFLGPGVLLFFFYLKYLRITICLFTLGYGSFALLSNIFSETQPDYSGCYNSGIIIQEWLCIANITSSYDRSNSTLTKVLQLTLGMIFAILWFFSINFTFFLGQKKNEEIDQMLQSSSDYTIRLQNLPSSSYNQHDLIHYINDLWENQLETAKQKLDLKSIHIIYNMSRCRQLIANIQNHSLKAHSFIKAEKQVQEDELQEYKIAKHCFLEYCDELSQLQTKFKENDEFRKSMSTTFTLIQFKTQEQQKQFLQKYATKPNKNLFDCFADKVSYKFQDKQIKISRAPQPSDINWANCEIQFSYFRYIMIWVATMFLLYACYALISYTNTIDFVRETEGVLVSFVLQLFNRIIWLSLSSLVSFEYQNTKTEAMISLMKKSIFAQVMNVIVIPIFLKFFNNKPLYGESSLASTMLTYQFIMFLMTTLFYVLNPLYYWKRFLLWVKCFRNKIIRMKAEVVGEIDTIDEIKPVLSYYEGTQFPIAGAYVYMITATFLTLFYCHLQPIILFILIMNITGFYLIMKYLLFRRSKIPELTDFQVFQFATFTVSYGSMFYSAGSLFFIIIHSYQVNNSLAEISAIQLIPSSISFFIWLILSANPLELQTKMSTFLFTQFKFNVINFDKVEQKPDENYEAYDIISAILNSKSINAKRKQSYYTYSNANRLLNYEYQLKEIRNQKKINEHKSFCESFFRESRPFTSKSRRKSNESDNVLIPVDIVSKQKRQAERLTGQLKISKNTSVKDELEDIDIDEVQLQKKGKKLKVKTKNSNKVSFQGINDK